MKVFCFGEINPNGKIPISSSLSRFHTIKFTPPKSFDLELAVGGGSVIYNAKVLSAHNQDYDYEFVEDLIKEKIFS